MTFLLLTLLQQPPKRLSKVVIIGAVLVLIAGASLLVYFYRRYKRVEKEAEEDWDASRHSLFVNVQPASGNATEASDSAYIEAEAPVAGEAAGTVNVQPGATRALVSDTDLPAFAPVTAEPEPRAEAITPAESQPQAAPPIEHRATEILASPPLAEAGAETEAEHDTAAFDEEVWADLDVAEQRPGGNEGTSPLTTEPPRVVRVADQSHREPFEAPRIERISQRELYEPPRIEPLTPRDAAATRKLQSAQPLRPELRDVDHAEEPMVLGTAMLGSASEAARSKRETPEPPVELVPAGPGLMPEPSTQSRTTSRMHRAGSILGLPAEVSHQPLIFGEPVRPADEAGIGALTNYGKDVGPKGGRAGTISLLVVIALLGGAVGLYFFVPSVHSRVGAFAARLRGLSIESNAASNKPAAQVIPSYRPEVNKNMVTARGAVDNISDQPLENLSIEVSLQRGDGGSMTRTIPVTPTPVPPGGRGFFEFEYDGKRDTGFASYTITKLLSNGAEVKFRTPQK